jgi:hypothetical protein
LTFGDAISCDRNVPIESATVALGSFSGTWMPSSPAV